MLKKRPTQYTKTLAECSALLEKVRTKVDKSKLTRVDKKTKIKEKMENGEYLPRDVYEAQRKAKLEKRAQEQTAKKKEAKEDGTENTENAGHEQNEKKPFKKPFKSINGEKTEFKKGKNDEKKTQNWKKDKENHQKGGENWKTKGNTQIEHKKYQNDKIKEFKKEKAQEKPGVQRLHPSWEARKMQVDRDSHIKFVNNEIFEF